MTAFVGRVDLEVRAAPHRRGRADEVARELRSALESALSIATANQSDDGVAFVERIHVTLSAPLSRVSGGDLSRAVADACVEAMAVRTAVIPDRADGIAEAIVRGQGDGDGVRCGSPAEEAAAWLVGMIVDQRNLVRRASPFADLDHLASGAALAGVCARVGDARAVTRALGSRWSRLLAERCDEREAAALLGLLDDGSEPGPKTWRLVRDRWPAPRQGRRARAALVLALDGADMDLPGVVAAVRSIAEGASDSDDRDSSLIGLWLLIPFLARHLGAVGERDARAITLAVAERLAGAAVDNDPAIAAVCGGETPDALRAAIAPSTRVDFLAVAAIRDFARGIRHFERARCTYVLRNILSGPSAVRVDATGAHATLPESPLRVLLERAALIGSIETPWGEPRLWIERDP